MPDWEWNVKEPFIEMLKTTHCEFGHLDYILVDVYQRSKISHCTSHILLKNQVSY